MKAYPIMFKHPTTGAIIENQGMELRDWFAGMALPSLADALNDGLTFEQVVGDAYKIADAMIKQREVKNV
jgi:hypothetical protein